MELRLWSKTRSDVRKIMLSLLEGLSVSCRMRKTLICSFALHITASVYHICHLQSMSFLFLWTYLFSFCFTLISLILTYQKELYVKIFLFSFSNHYEKFKAFALVWERGGFMVSALDPGSSGPGSSPGRCHCVVFLGKKLYTHIASLHPGVQMGTSKYAGGNPAMD